MFSCMHVTWLILLVQRSLCQNHFVLLDLAFFSGFSFVELAYHDRIGIEIYFIIFIFCPIVHALSIHS